LGFFREKKLMNGFTIYLGILNLLIVPGIVCVVRYVVKLEKRLLNIEGSLEKLMAQNGIKFIKG